MKRKLLFAMLCIVSALGLRAQSWTAPTIGVTPTTGNKYKVLNLGAGMYLNGGQAYFGWNTTAIVASTETEWTFTGDASSFTLTSSGTTGIFTSGNGIEGDAMHVDNTAQSYAITLLSNGYYQIHDPGASYKKCWGYNSSFHATGIVAHARPAKSGWYTDWVFLTEIPANLDVLLARYKLYHLYERYFSDNEGSEVAAAKTVYDNGEATVEQLNDAYTTLYAARYAHQLAVASDSDPRDITEFVLTNPDFSTGDISGWETDYVSGVQAENIGYQGASYTNGDVNIHRFIEAWRWSPALGNGYLRQTVSDLPEGKYVLECDAIAADQPGGTMPTGAQLYITADALDYPKDMATENNKPQHFSVQFLNSDLGNDVIFGLRTVSTTANWLCADNFTVTFYGIDLSAYAKQLQDEVDAFDDMKSSIESTVRSNLQTQVDALDIVYKSSSAYAAAISNMQTINAYATALIAANTAKNNSTYENVVGTELTALNTAIGDAPTYADYATYAAKTSALTTATSAFTAAATNYDALVREIAKAKNLGVADATADSYAATSSTTSATALTNTHNLMVDEYEFVADEYTEEVVIDPSKWTPSGDYGTMTSQHWSGNGSEPYYEQSSAAWGSSSWSLAYTTTTSLPAGNYVFKVAGRRSSSAVNMTLTVAYNETEAIVNDFPMGDVGLGINKSGVTSFDAEDAAGFANSNNGRGWQWRYVKFTLADPAEVTLTVTGVATASWNWLGFCNASLLTDDAKNIALIESLVALTEAKNAATLDEHTNKGSGIFQYDKTTDDGLWSAYSTAKSDAEAFTLTSSSTSSEVETLASALNNAINNYNNLTLNAPDAEKRYVLTIVEAGKAWNGNAVTFRENCGDNTDQGNFGIKYQTTTNTKYNQAIKFTATTGNKYKLSVTSADGTEMYLTTSKKGYNKDDGGFGDERIRMTSDASKALEVEILPTSTDNQFQLYNSTAPGIIANNNDDGMYTANSCNFTIAEASQASSVTVSAKAGKYGTVIFPFKPDVSTGFDGITFYSCGDVNAETQRVLIEEVATPVANTPYLIKNASGEDFSKAVTGWGAAYKDEYTSGLLTGVYTAATIEASVEPTASENGAYRYVLQTPTSGANVGVQAFYKVTSDFTATAYKCFMTIPQDATGGGAVKAFFLDFGDADAINAVEATQAENAEIYNLAGQRLNKAQKGVNIVNGKKVLIK